MLFTGAIPHNEVPQYAAAADLFVFPSQVETQGLVLIEAMAAGTPVVAVETIGSIDVLSDGGGILVPDEEEAFKNAILELLSSEKRRAAMASEALEAAQHYTIESATAKMEKVYEEATQTGFRYQKRKRRRIFKKQE